MTIFIIGPSGAGKSLLLERISPQLHDAIVVDLDVEENEATSKLKPHELGGWDGRWRRNMEILERIECQSEKKPILVDVGAGSLQTEAAFRYFNDRLANIILITAEKDVLCARRSRTMDDLISNEFTVRHNDLYRAISRAVDNDSEDTSQAQEALLAHISAISSETTEPE